MAEQEFKHIVRVANTDIDGNKKVVDAMRKIKGVSFMLANAVCRKAGVSPAHKTGHLSDKDVAALQLVLENLIDHVPAWMLNRRKDYETGKDLHLLTNDLKFQQDMDKKRLQRIKSYKGLRHAVGLPVRGQRTKSNFRRNKGKKR